MCSDFINNLFSSIELTRDNQTPRGQIELDRSAKINQNLIYRFIFNEGIGTRSDDLAYGKNAIFYADAEINQNGAHFITTGDNARFDQVSLTNFSIFLDLTTSAYRFAGWVMPAGEYNTEPNWIGRRDTGEYRLYFSDSTTAAINTDIPPLNTRETWCITYDGSNARFYINGVYKGLYALSSKTFILNAIGYAYNTTSISFAGDMHQFALYENRILSLEDIQELHANRYSGIKSSVNYQFPASSGMPPSFKPHWAIMRNSNIIGGGL